MKEDQVVNDTLCPEDKPTTRGYCNSNTCYDGCNPDGSCFFACNRNTLACVQVFNSDYPFKEQLLCNLKCCTCRKFQRSPLNVQ